MDAEEEKDSKLEEERNAGRKAQFRSTFQPEFKDLSSSFLAGEDAHALPEPTAMT